MVDHLHHRQHLQVIKEAAAEYAYNTYLEKNKKRSLRLVVSEANNKYNLKGDDQIKEAMVRSRLKRRASTSNNNNNLTMNNNRLLSSAAGSSSITTTTNSSSSLLLPTIPPMDSSLWPSLLGSAGTGSFPLLLSSSRSIMIPPAAASLLSASRGSSSSQSTMGAASSSSFSLRPPPIPIPPLPAVPAASLDTNTNFPTIQPPFHYKPKHCRSNGCTNPPTANSSFCRSHKCEKDRETYKLRQLASSSNVLVLPRTCGTAQERATLFDLKAIKNYLEAEELKKKKQQQEEQELKKKETTSFAWRPATWNQEKGTSGFVDNAKPESLKDVEDHHFTSHTYVDRLSLVHCLEHFIGSVDKNVKPGPYHPGKNHSTKTSVVKQLANAERGAKIDQLYQFENAPLLEKVREKLIEAVYNSPLRETLMDANGLKFSELITVRIQGKDVEIPPNAFAIVDVHPCLAQDSVATVMHHRDKAGVSGLAAFYGIGGISYNLLETRRKGDDPDAKAYYAKGEGDYHLLMQYIQDCGADPELKGDKEKVEKYMDEFLDACEPGTRVLIFFMVPGRLVVFNADACLHGTIVPRGIHRCLAIFYWLEPITSTFLIEDSNDFRAAKKAGQVGVVADVLLDGNHQRDWRKKHPAIDDPLAKISNAGANSFPVSSRLIIPPPPPPPAAASSVAASVATATTPAAAAAEASVTEATIITDQMNKDVVDFPDPRNLIGKRIAKDFKENGGICYGTVRSYEPHTGKERGFWDVLYDDGDNEGYNSDQINPLLAFYEKVKSGDTINSQPIVDSYPVQHASMTLDFVRNDAHRWAIKSAVQFSVASELGKDIVPIIEIGYGGDICLLKMVVDACNQFDTGKKKPSRTSIHGVESNKDVHRLALKVRNDMGLQDKLDLQHRENGSYGYVPEKIAKVLIHEIFGRFVSNEAIFAIMKDLTSRKPGKVVVDGDTVSVPTWASTSWCPVVQNRAPKRPDPELPVICRNPGDHRLTKVEEIVGVFETYDFSSLDPTWAERHETQVHDKSFQLQVKKNTRFAGLLCYIELGFLDHMIKLDSRKSSGRTRRSGRTSTTERVLKSQGYNRATNWSPVWVPIKSGWAEKTHFVNLEVRCFVTHKTSTGLPKYVASVWETIGADGEAERRLLGTTTFTPDHLDAEARFGKDE